MRYKIVLIIVAVLVFYGCVQKLPKTYSGNYSSSSNFVIEQLDSTTIGNLAVLGRVWGFVKYHHPAFADSTYNIDYELFELLPKVVDANKDDRNRILSEWVDSFGKFKFAPKKYEKRLSKANCIQTTDCAWIKNVGEIGEELSAKLQRLRYADRKSNIYISKHPDRPLDQSWLYFDKEEVYVNISLSDYKYRLLSLFRYWNIIEYFFPYRNLTDNAWSEILKKYIPLFLQPQDMSYKYAVSQLIAEINDTHGYTNLRFIFGGNYTPLNVSFVDDKLIFVSADTYKNSPDSCSLQAGDEIISVNGRTPEQTLNLTKRYCANSNRASLLRNAAKFSMYSKGKDSKVVYKRDAVEKTTVVKTVTYWEFKERKAFKRINDSVGYLYPALSQEKDAVGYIKKQIDSTKIVIVDHRCYPKFTTQILPHFMDSRSHISNFAYPIDGLPGYFIYTRVEYDFANIKPYKGRILVLVNEHTQSMAEYMTMVLQTKQGVIVIGSQTAGADGDVSQITLPGNIRTMMSGLGVYYPDGTPTQRVGVKIDYYVEPTIEGIKAGRDEVLEKALEIISSNY